MGKKAKDEMRRQKKLAAVAPRGSSTPRTIGGRRQQRQHAQNLKAREIAHQQEREMLYLEAKLSQLDAASRLNELNLRDLKAKLSDLNAPPSTPSTPKPKPKPKPKAVPKRIQITANPIEPKREQQPVVEENHNPPTPSQGEKSVCYSVDSISSYNQDQEQYQEVLRLSTIRSQDAKSTSKSSHSRELYSCTEVRVVPVTLRELQSDRQVESTCKSEDKRDDEDEDEDEEDQEGKQEHGDWLHEFKGQNLFCLNPPEGEATSFVDKWRNQADQCRQHFDQDTDYKWDAPRASHFGFYFSYMWILLSDKDDSFQDRITEEDRDFIRKVSRDQQQPSFFRAHALLLRALTDGIKNNLQTAENFVRGSILICSAAFDQDKQRVIVQLSGSVHVIGNLLHELEQKCKETMLRVTNQREDMVAEVVEVESLGDENTSGEIVSWDCSAHAPLFQVLLDLGKYCRSGSQ
ncbi:expressed unknown protein [Seminavis robusta]|uniref:Uncharacterized protein n=1 Tax=Seminavis robusta TaxID=568900 RepID=A0A9N8E0C4_9STRA|nr:expressed unknown protein [Seminavis robusta]|eukprot:Sro520_g159090.1 n/a (462) ;mRNA; f:9248-10633